MDITPIPDEQVPLVCDVRLCVHSSMSTTILLSTLVIGNQDNQ